MIDLSELSNTDLGLAQQVAVLPWFVGGVTEDDGAVRRVLLEVASRDIDFANEMAVLPWLSDGVTKLEISAIYSLDDLASKDEELVWKVIGWPRFEGGVERDLDFFFLHALGRSDPELLATLTARTWFDDGLTDEEAALVVSLAGQPPGLQNALLDVHHVYRQSISLPLAEKVNVWIVQSADLVSNEKVLSEIEDTLRIAEEIFRVPCPTTDVILLVSTEQGTDYEVYSGHSGSHMVLKSWEGKVTFVPHETTHYYLSRRNFDAAWLVEGGANLIEDLFHDRRGHQDISSRGSIVLDRIQTNCIVAGVESIRHNAYLVGREHISFFQCTYSMGENLLLNLLEIMGEEAMSSVLNELYVSSGGHVPALRFSTPPTEVEIYEAFLKHTPPEHQEEVRELFRRLHGGDFAFPEIDYDDAEADEPADAALIEIGETVEGSLDYIFDLDYFRFQAEQSQRYRISVEHENLGHSSITLFAPDGVSDERGRWKARGMGPDGPLILWMAPSAEEYYFAVQNFGGKTGDYALTITSVDIPETDDHGDTPESATEIRLGRRVSGTIDHAFDYDYFRFSAGEGEEYFFDFYGNFLNSLCSELYLSNGTAVRNWPNSCNIAERPSYGESYGIHWWSPQTDEYYLELYGFMERVGDYEFEIAR